VTIILSAQIPFTGSSMNPARSFGPAVVTGFWKDHWVNMILKTFVSNDKIIMFRCFESIELIEFRCSDVSNVQIQVYWLGPIMGGICASLIYQLVLAAPKPVEANPTTEKAVSYKEVNQKDDA
jgi:hypothetical protein